MEINEAARKYYTRFAGDVTISSKRQITIPARVVRELGLEPGDKLSVYLEGEEVVMIPKKQDWYDYITSRKPSGIWGRSAEEVDENIRKEREGWNERAKVIEGDAYVEEGN